MLGIGGKFASSKGMVAMPNIANLSRSAAIAAIQNAGLRLGNASVSNSSNSSDDQKVFQQNTPAGQLLDYETAVSFSYYQYVAPPVPQGPTLINTSSTGCVEYERYQVSSNCNSSTGIGTITYGFRRHSVTTYFYSDGTSSSVTSSCTDSSRTESQTIYNCSGTLNCSSPSRRYSDTLATGICSSGYGVFVIEEFPSGCGKATTTTFSFCTTNPNTANCDSCVSTQNYTVSNSGCASGLAFRTICTKPSGCSPASTDSYGGCIPVSSTSSGSSGSSTPTPAPAPVCGTSCTPWYRSSCQGGQRFVTRRCSDCNGQNEYRETYYESC